MPFTVEVSGAPEIEEGDPVEIAKENALRKARVVAERLPAPALTGTDGRSPAVLGVDTVVTLDGAVYGKAATPEEARAMLAVLSGREHTVVSGLALLRDGREDVVEARTRVRFRDIAHLLDWYVTTGEWRERAGAYAIQGQGAALVAGITGDYLNVVGLPVAALLDLWPGLVTDAR